MAVTQDPKSRQRIALVRESHLNSFAKTHNVTKETGITMAQAPQTQKPTPAKPNTPPPASNGAKVETKVIDQLVGGKPKKDKEKRPRVTLVSATEPAFIVRMFKADYDKFGGPKDHKGAAMTLKATQPFGGVKLTEEQKAARVAAKEADKARKANMSDEERLAEAKKRREEKQVAKQAKVEKERGDILAQVMADIAAGKIPGVKVV